MSSTATGNHRGNLVARWFADRTTPVHVVAGNHDTADEFGAFRTATDLTGRVLPVAERLFLAGVGWHGERYFELPLESDLRAVCDRVGRPPAPPAAGITAPLPPRPAPQPGTL